MKQMTGLCIRFLLITVLLLYPFDISQSVQADSFGLEAFGECHFVTLSWNHIPQAESYWIFRGTSADKIHSMPLTDFPVKETFYVDKNDLVLGQEFFYYVSAVGPDHKEFAKSAVVSAIPHCEEQKTPPPCKLVLKYQVGNTLYWVNDDSHGPMDTAPIILQSRMFLVIRYVTNPIEGTQLLWDSTERKVTIITREGRIIELWIGKKDAKIDGNTIQIDPNNPQVVPIIMDGRTLLPLRFVGTNLGAESVEDIVWYASSQTVEIFVDDPACDKAGFRYPKALPLKGSFFEFSVEYHTQKEDFPNEVRLTLAKSDNTKTLRIGPNQRKPSKLDLKSIPTPEPSVEEINSGVAKARRYRFRFALEPGVLHFYAFTADNKESLPPEGYLGPVYATLPDSQRLDGLDIEKIEEGASLTIQGYFTIEPYPMLVNDYWEHHEMAETSTMGLMVQLDQQDQIEEGSFVCLKVQKRTTKGKLPILKLNKLLFEQKIKIDKPIVNEIVMGPPVAALRNQHRFALVYSGCIDDAKVKDSEGVKHVYQRSRADFVGEVLNCYKTCFAMGIPKRNIYVNFARGEGEIDQICADDGDGNPLDFDWDDSEFRNTMEQDAERWWFMDDGWQVRLGTRAELYNSISEIKTKIDLLSSDITPEVNIFIFTHGSTNGLCSYSDGGMQYSNLINEITPLMENSIASLHARTKIRFMNDTCHAGAILPHVEGAFRSSGLNYFQIAMSSRPDELSWGVWPKKEESSYAGAGGSFGIAFRESLNEQAQASLDDQVDWEVAYDYAAVHDIYVSGVEHEKDDGTTVMVYTHPQYWHSRDRTLFQAGPAFEDPLSPEQEVRATRCRIGIDTTESTFDICNCSQSDSIHTYPQSNLTVVNRGIIPFRVVEIRADESVLSKTVSHPVLIFRNNDHESCREQPYISVDLDYNESYTFSICLNNMNLNAQPLDANGYMATEDNVPKFVQVPITVVYECGLDQLTQRATIQLRVKAESYQMRYKTSVNRSETIKGDFSTWEEVTTDTTITPVFTGLPENILAGPANDGNIKIRLKTDIFRNPSDQKIIYDHLKLFKLEFFFDYTGESTDCIDSSSCLTGAWVTSATIPTKLKNKLHVKYPDNICSPEKTISIIVDPQAHSRDGYLSLLGKHTFVFDIKRIAHFNCENVMHIYNYIHLEIELEFVSPTP